MSEGVLVSTLVGIVVATLVIKLSAIQRRLNRLSRLEAKVDALLKGVGVPFDPFQDVPVGVREALERGEKIVAIKLYREATGKGLKEAKELVDELRRRAVAAD